MERQEADHRDAQIDRLQTRAEMPTLDDEEVYCYGMVS